MTVLVPLARAYGAQSYGAKAANLGCLLRAGVHTAPGVVIPLTALFEHVRRAQIEEALHRLFDELPALKDDELSIRAASLRAAVLQTPLAPSLREALADHHAQLPAGARLAVRSSGLGEDGARASFAGQFETRLDVATLCELEDAVRAVWASICGERALKYARRLVIRPAGLAVILQQQVDASISGVLFSRDPRTDRDDALLVEYCAGLAERLVSGEITPARLRMDRRTFVVTTEQSPAQPMPFDLARAPVLAELARTALELERVFGSAQDIEWSIDAQGRLTVLQSRPITAPALGAPRVEWSNANIAENFPEPVSPFLCSFVARGYAAYFRGLGIAFGISRRRMTALDHALEHIVGAHAGRLYYNLSNIHAVLHLAPGGAWLARFFNQFTGAHGFPQAPRIHASLLARVAEAVRIAVKIPWHYLTVQRRVARFEAVADAFARDTQPHLLVASTREALADHIRKFLDIRLDRWTDAALADTAAMVCYGVLKLMLARWLPARDQVGLQNDLLKGLPGLASAAPVEQLWALSRMARADERLDRVLRDEPAESVLNHLHAPQFAPFRAALDEYFARWGFRYSGELMLTRPTPQEQPLPVIRLLQTYVRADVAGPAEVSALQAAARELETQRVEAALTETAWIRALPLVSRAAWFRLVLRATQAAIRLRERARMKQALLYTRLRHVALALGDRLVAAGVLSRREDVFFLTTHEALDLAGGTALLPGSVASTIDARRREHAACADLQPPDSFALACAEQWTVMSAPALVPRTTADRMHGSAACGGTVVGSAAVALEVADADRIGAGQILVTRQTDPGWAAVFFLVGGLVVERGGMLSHGAIIAREYGIPAVVGVPDATRMIRDGDLVRVDGDRGTVERCYA